MSNGAEAIADAFRKKYGRGAEDVLEAALVYIDRQGSLEAWEEHLYMDAPPNLWELFDEDSKPSIQKVDDYAPKDYTDIDAAYDFVEDLERGTPDAVAAATKILAFHSEQAKEEVRKWPLRGATVHVPEPERVDDAWNYAFTGTVVGFRRGSEDLLIVEDMEENCFDVEVDRVEIDRNPR